MACRFELASALSIFSWTPGTNTRQTADRIRAYLHVPLTYPQFPETQFFGRDYVFYLKSPKGYAGFQWVLENKKVHRNHVTYLIRQA